MNVSNKTKNISNTRSNSRRMHLQYRAQVLLRAFSEPCPSLELYGKVSDDRSHCTYDVHLSAILEAPMEDLLFRQTCLRSSGYLLQD
jgi:hypothetical protein